MNKKRITACIALGVLSAIALPAVAQAVNKPLITHPTGKVLAPGVKMKATNVGNTLLVNTAGGTELTCTTAAMTGELTKNETGNVQGNISASSFSGTGASGACTGFANAVVDTLSTPWCLKSTSTMEADEFQVSGGLCSEAAKKITFQLTPTAFPGTTCTYEATFAIGAKGTFTTHSTGDALMTVPRTGHTPTEDAGFTKTHDTTPFELCPKSGALRMTFTLETDTATAEPLYISE
jgi:hypothetical protein